MANNEDVSLFERFIIMMFGLGVVLVGLYPLSRQYGGVREFLKEKTSKVFSSYNQFEKSVGRARLSDDSEKPRTEKKAIVVEENRKPKDKITNKDREELDKLIDKVWQ